MEPSRFGDFSTDAQQAYNNMHNLRFTPGNNQRLKELRIEFLKNHTPFKPKHTDIVYDPNYRALKTSLEDHTTIQNLTNAGFFSKTIMVAAEGRIANGKIDMTGTTIYVPTRPFDIFIYHEFVNALRDHELVHAEDNFHGMTLPDKKVVTRGSGEVQKKIQDILAELRAYDHQIRIAQSGIPVTDEYIHQLKSNRREYKFALNKIKPRNDLEKKIISRPEYTQYHPPLAANA